MKEKMSKLIEMIIANKMKAIALSAAAVVIVTGAVAATCAIAKHQGGVPVAPAASEPSKKQEASKPEKIESTPDKASSQEDAGSETVTSNKEKDIVSKEETAPSEDSTSESAVSKKEPSSKETVPKKKKASNIDSRVEIGVMKLSNSPQYTLKKAKVVDKRTWGKAPTISVTDDCMHVIYYNKKGQKIEFEVEQPVVKDTINRFTILDDGTYVGDYFGAFS